jgi:flagellar hook-length control protein FliK
MTLTTVNFSQLLDIQPGKTPTTTNNGSVALPGDDVKSKFLAIFKDLSKAQSANKNNTKNIDKSLLQSFNNFIQPEFEKSETVAELIKSPVETSTKNILISLLNLSQSKLSNIPAGLISQVGEGSDVETKERVLLNPQILKVLLTNSKDKVEVKVSQSDLKALIDSHVPVAQFSIQPRPESKSIVIAEIVAPNDQIKEQGQGAKVSQVISNINSDIVASDSRISFDLSDIFSKNQNSETGSIPATIFQENNVVPNETVDISKLLTILEKYPDPITVELSNLHDSIISSRANQVQVTDQPDTARSVFLFDLRDLIKSEGNDKGQVEGVLTIAHQQYPASVKNTSQSNQPSLLKTEIPEEIFQTDNNQTINNKPIIDTNAVTAKMASANSTVVTSNQPVELSRSDNFAPIIQSGINAQVESGLAMKVKLPANIKINSDENTEPKSELSETGGHQTDLEKPAIISNSEQPQLSEQKSDQRDLPELKKRNISRESVIRQIRLNDRIKLAVAPDQIGGKPVFNSPRVFDIGQKEITNLNELKNAIYQAVGKQLNSLKIKLQPENLGNVDIKLSWKNDTLQIVLKTDNESAEKLLNSNLKELKGGLENASFKVQNISVVMDNDYNPQNGGTENQNLGGGSHNSSRRDENSNSLASADKQNRGDDTPRKKSNPAWSWIDMEA